MAELNGPDFQHGCPVHLSVLFQMEVPDLACPYEYAVHQFLDDRRVLGEWFDVPAYVAKDIIKRVIEGRLTAPFRPWTIKALPLSVKRDIKAAARREGVTVAEWLHWLVCEWKPAKTPF